MKEDIDIRWAMFKCFWLPYVILPSIVLVGIITVMVIALQPFFLWLGSWLQYLLSIKPPG